MQLERETTEAGRTYHLLANTDDAGRTELSLIVTDHDGQMRSELRGTLDSPDLATIARVLRPELAGIGAWLGLPPDDRAFTLAQRRRNHPNAYSPWSEDEERRLIDMHDSRMSQQEMARSLGRNVGAITRRLEKLQLIPVS